MFVEVARDGSFTGAARRLGMSKAATTKHVAWLEQSLGAKLLDRTTKHVGLTEAGAHALGQGQLLLEGYEEIGSDARELVAKPRGVIRVGTPPSFGTHHLLPLVTRFTERYPEIRVVLMLDDGSANLITQGLDLSLRIGPAPEDAGHIARPAHQGAAGAGGVEGLSAAARHAARRRPISPPQLPGALAEVADQHLAVLRQEQAKCRCGCGAPWRRTSAKRCKQAALLGHGIAMHPYYMVSDDLKAGRLMAVLPTTSRSDSTSMSSSPAGRTCRCGCATSSNT